MAAVVAPTHVSHHDATRAAVSTTALGVCAVRVWESKKDPSERPLTNSGRRRRRMMMVNMMILPEIKNMTILLESWWGWGGYTDGLHLFWSTVWHFTCCSFLSPLLCWRIVPFSQQVGSLWKFLSPVKRHPFHILGLDRNLLRINLWSLCCSLVWRW